MIYVIEQPQREEKTAFLLRGGGPAESLEDLRRHLVSATFAAAEEFEISERETAGLLAQLVSMGGVYEQTDLLLSIFYGESLLVETRKRQLARQASRGLVSSVTVMEEFRLLDKDSWQRATLLDRNGYVAGVDYLEDANQYVVAPKIATGEKSAELIRNVGGAIAVRQGLDAYVLGYELVNDTYGRPDHVRSDDMLHVLGHAVLGADGRQVFEPSITVR